MTDCTVLLTPEEVRNALARPGRWGFGLALEKRLCRDYLTLWDRNKELEEDKEDMDKEQFDANIRGAIYDFAGYLMTLDDNFVVGAKHNATRMSEEVSNWFAKNSLGPTGPFPTSLPPVNADWAYAPEVLHD